MPLKLRTMVKMSDIPVDITFNQLLSKTSREMETEFNLLDVYSELSHSSNIAMEPQNKSKNRYSDILPCKTKNLYDYLSLISLLILL